MGTLGFFSPSKSSQNDLITPHFYLICFGKKWTFMYINYNFYYHVWNLKSSYFIHHLTQSSYNFWILCVNTIFVSFIMCSPILFSYISWWIFLSCIFSFHLFLVHFIFFAFSHFVFCKYLSFVLMDIKMFYASFMSTQFMWIIDVRELT
jgi:hypothetical protein